MRMFPATHDTLLKMAKYQVTDLCGLFDMLANHWKSRTKFVRSEDATTEGAEVEFLGFVYDAKIALEGLRLRVEWSPSVAEKESTKRAWQGLRQEWEQLASTISAVES